MVESIHGFVLSKLRAMPPSQWIRVAESSGVPLSTVRKIGYEETRNPGINAIEPLYHYFRSQEAAP